MKAICAICGGGFHPWQLRDGVCEACIDPQLRAIEDDARRREGRALRWQERARRGRWWAAGLGGIGVLIGMVAVLFALVGRACGDAGSAIVGPPAKEAAGHAIESGAQHVLHGIDEATRSIK